MDKMCGSDAMVLDGNIKPGTTFQLSAVNKFQPDFTCTIKFRTAQPTQRLVISVEQLSIADCPGDTLKIYDGTNLLNKDVKQQCGSPAAFSFTVGCSMCCARNRGFVFRRLAHKPASPSPRVKPRKQPVFKSLWRCTSPVSSRGSLYDKDNLVLQVLPAARRTWASSCARTRTASRNRSLATSTITAAMVLMSWAAASSARNAPSSE